MSIEKCSLKITFNPAGCTTTGLTVNATQTNITSVSICKINITHTHTHTLHIHCTSKGFFSYSPIMLM